MSAKNVTNSAVIGFNWGMKTNRCLAGLFASIFLVAVSLLCTARSEAQSASSRSRDTRLSSVGSYESTLINQSGVPIAVFELRQGKTLLLTRLEAATGKALQYEGNWDGSGGKVYVSLTKKEGKEYKERIAFQRTGDTLTAIDFDSTKFAMPGDAPLVVRRSLDASDRAFVTGIIRVQNGDPLPAKSVVSVQLADVSLADAPAQVLSEAVLRDFGNPPIPFRLAYRKSAIVLSHTYAVMVRVTEGGTLRYITTTRYAVITNGAGRVIEVQVDKVAGR